MNHKFSRFLLTFSLLALISSSVDAKPLTIRNETLQVVVDDTSNEFAIQLLPSSRTIVSHGKLLTAKGKTTTSPVSDPLFGQGDSIVVFDPSGASAELLLFPKLPFVLIRSTLKNAGSADLFLNRVGLAGFDVALDQPGASLTTLGTSGLLAADKNPGSYAWLAIAEPQTRHGVVTGWLSHDRASGVLFTKTDDAGVLVDARSDYGHLRIAPGATADTETLAIGYFDDARLGLEAWADAVAQVYKIKLPPQPSGFCTWYTEKYGKASDEKHLAALAEFSAQKLKPYGLGFIQIDDYWQEGDSQKNGPNKNFTASRATGPYPSGMKATADNLKRLGFTPGIWFMPFAGTFNDPWFKNHQDWFVKDTKGQPYDTKWGGTSLDMTKPEVRDYLRSIVTTIAKEWGYQYFKMDGLYTGVAVKQVYVNSGYKEDEMGDAVFANPDKTNIEAFRDGLKLVRDAAGPDVFFLGCTVTQNMRSYGASIGLVNAMRIGPDNSGKWDRWSKSSPVFGSRHYFLNGRIWYNDPDPNYVRSSIDIADARTIASWSAISGQLNSNSDWIPDLPPERIDILKRTLQPHGRTARPVDFFENDPPRLWLVTDEKSSVRRDVIGVFNWAEEKAQIETPLARFGLPNGTEYVAFDYWANTFVAPFKDTLKASLPKHGCQILAVRPLLAYPFLLSTSRHVTQGMIDVTDEKWESAAKTLSAKSQIIAGDAYELRIYAPVKPQAWKATKAELSAEDQVAGAQISYTQTDSGLRVTVRSPTTRTVNWKVHFN